MNPWVEKILFAVGPLLVSGVMYLFSSVSTLQTSIIEVKTEAAMARQQMKEEIRNEVKQNAVNIALLQEQVATLKEQQVDK